ncbi:MAG: helix-turn-helix transcriptional regulator [Alphaproteobacteria bacterium]|nr:helix-turn-helix transcriptional regulator [Alphaproteobacteria bacterium]
MATRSTRRSSCQGEASIRPAQRAACSVAIAPRAKKAQLPPGSTGWLAGLKDPAVGHALSLMHARLNEDWTTEGLAERVNLSRSAFAERFSEIVGVPPMRYLLNWRMAVASHRLRESRLAISQIAFEVGYESEAAFTRAFRREFGVPPAAWRKAGAAGQAGNGAV